MIPSGCSRQKIHPRECEREAGRLAIEFLD
jgi:hypothetical protein